MPFDTRYVAGGNNTLLRMILWDLWGFKCHWCNKPVDFGDTQLDHIIPKSATAELIAELVHAHGLEDNYDVHDLRNLAPICQHCNGRAGKGSSTRRLFTPAVGDNLEKAMRFRPEAVKRLQEFPKSGGLAKSMSHVITADLGAPKSRKVFDELAPGIIQRLAVLNEALLTAYISYRKIEIDLGGDWFEVDATIDATTRRAMTVLEDVYSTDFEDMIQEPMKLLYEEVLGETQGGFERFRGPDGGPTVAGQPSGDVVVTIDTMTYDNEAQSPSFTVAGHFEASLVSSLFRYDANGDPLETDEEDYITGEFTFFAFWKSSDAGRGIEASEPEIESWESSYVASREAAEAREEFELQEALDMQALDLWSQLDEGPTSEGV